MNSENITNEFIVKTDDKKLYEDLDDQLNKENVIDEQYNRLPAKRIIRLSTLQVLDPYTPNILDKTNSNSEIVYLDVYNKSIIEEMNEGDKSFNLLNFNDSIVEDYSAEREIKTPTKSSGFDFLNNDFGNALTNSPELGDISNISQMLDVSVEHDDVATENLIGLSPVQSTVEKRKFDTIKVYHNQKKEEWLAEKMEYETRIFDLKVDYEAKILNLIKENKEELEKVEHGHLDELSAHQLERQEMVNLMENMYAQLKNLHDEKMSTESDRTVDTITGEQFNDRMCEIIKENEEQVNKLNQDNEKMQSFMEICVKRNEKSSETIKSLNKNQATLIEEIDKNRAELSDLNNRLRDSGIMVRDTKQSTEQELGELRSFYDERVKLLETKIRNAGSNLKDELRRRDKERNQLQEIVDALVTDC